MSGYLPRATFALPAYPDSDDYFIVYVANTLKQMRATVKRCGFTPIPRMVAGCSVVTCGIPEVVGVLWFHKPLGAGIVTHELAHAAFRVIERYGGQVRHGRTDQAPGQDPGVTTEEYYALVIEHLTKAFWNEAYRTGLVKMEAQDVA